MSKSIHELSSELDEYLKELQSESISFESAVKTYSASLKIAEKIQKRLESSIQKINILNSKSDQMISKLSQNPHDLHN
jgi:exonuclease VII small subunit